jgi:hypothetical protein
MYSERHRFTAAHHKNILHLPRSPKIMLMKKMLLLFTLMCLFSLVRAQLPNGSIAPDFTATDINGQSHNLYSLLNQGYTVYLDVSATWCGPCWNYHNTHAFEDLWEQYGPPGTDNVYCLMIEGDPSTNTNCLYGPSGCNNSTWGNWTAGVSYPIIDDSAVADLYQISYFPTIYMICSNDKKVYEVGQLSASGLWNKRNVNCASAVSVTVNNVSDVRCLGTNTGAIDITVGGGIAPYTYNWSNGAQTQDLVNVPAGTYSCNITAANGISGNTGPVTVSAPATALSLQLEESMPVGCNGVVGSITVAAQGGWDTNYNYQWSNGQTGPQAVGLLAGTYKVTVTDDNNCTKTISHTLVPPTYPTVIIASPDTVNCAHPVIALNGTGSSTGPEFAYNWVATNGGHIVSGQQTLQPSVDAAGTYSLLVTNTTLNCVSVKSTPVTANKAIPLADADSTGFLNCAVLTDTLHAQASLGPVFSYLWTGPGVLSGGNTLSPVVNKGGKYTLKVSNTQNGCIKSDTTIVSRDTIQPTLLLVTPEHLNCRNDSVALQTYGSSQGPDFVYAWEGPSGFSSNEENPRVDLPGWFYLTIQNNQNNCFRNDSVRVLQFNAVQVAFDTVSVITCNGASNGLARAAAGGGYGAFSYSWNTGDSTAQVQGLSAGLYSVTVTDADACSASNQITLTDPVLLSANLSTTGETAVGANDGTATTVVSGGTAPYNFVWSNGANTPLLNNLSPGTYTVTITDANACTTLRTASVSGFNCTLSTQLNATNSTCFGANNGTAQALQLGGNAPFNYHWNTGDTTSSVQNLSPGTYTVTVNDASGCENASDVTITQPPLLQVSATDLQHPLCQNNANGVISVTTSGGIAPYGYAWNNGANTPSIEQLLPGSYQLTITDAVDCIRLHTVTLIPSDDEAPQIKAQNSTVYLDAQGNHALSLADVQGELTDNCAVANYTFFPVTTLNCKHIGAAIPVELRATDEQGNTNSRILQITVVDNMPPVVNCPDDLSVNACAPTANVTHPAPVASDNCGLNTIMFEQIGGLPNGSAFPVGGTTQTYRFTDMSGNSGTCSFNIFVNAPVSVNAYQSAPATVGMSNGAISVDVVGGTAPYMFKWTRDNQDIAFTEDLQGIPSGLYTLHITDANGCQIILEVEVGSVVNTTEPIWARGMQLTPNPSQGWATLSFKQPMETDVYLRVSDQQGRLVLESRYSQPQTIVINLSDEASGAYYLLLSNGLEQVTRTLIINR